MSFGKIIFPILMQFFAFRKSDSGLSSQALLLNAITATFKKEISGIILKVAFGLVATGVLIYSLVTLGQYFHAYLLKFESGILLSVLFFIFLSGTCIFAVFKLFYEKKDQTDPFESLFSKSDEKNLGIQKIFANFMDGLNNGMSKAEESSSSDKAEEADYKHSGTTH